MATLVFSTVGNALGGPVGGAIGALIGQSFDQQLLGPVRRGPRLGDLNVQTSTYGTQIPRLYGSMRVAGSVVWATDLVESEQTSGAKGQPDVTYSYSVSLAVALSSRVAGSIGRIWADGQLLRGAEGDFKVPATFRFYDGSEDQPVDPLIGSIEGIANTPAYRGLAIAVFEDLQLATFGNRIPFMTFEVFGDDGPVWLSSILSDASAGAIVADSTDTVSGYAAYGASVATAVAPLVTSFGAKLFDDGIHLRAPIKSDPIILSAQELGNSGAGEAAPKFERERVAAETAPGTLRLTYYDESRDYQAGEARALSGQQAGAELQQDLPVVLTAGQAKALAHGIIAREWASLDRLRLRLPPGRLDLEPGAVVRSDAAGGSWVVESTTIEGFATVADLRPLSGTQAVVSAEGGRAVSAPDIVDAPATLAIIDIPNMTGSAANSPVVLIAASSPSAGWRRRSLTVTTGGISTSLLTAGRKSVLGSAQTMLADAAPELIDNENFVDVELIDVEQWLTSCDDAALGAGANLAMLGSELVQFGTATALGGGRFRLSRLLRGRGGTEWATADHAANERFCLIDASRMASVELPLAARGSVLKVEDSSGAVSEALFGAEWVRPLAPTHFGALADVSGWSFSWTRRSRSGFAWLDDIDAPLGEAAERYRVTLSGTAGQAEIGTDAPSLFVPASALVSLGSGPVRVDVTQLGDCAASRPASITISLP